MGNWDGKTKGTLLGYQIMLFLVRHTPVPFVYLILRFISSYFFFFDTETRKALLSFYTTAFGVKKPKALRLISRNLYQFSQTLVDRMLFLVGRSGRFTLSIEHEDYLIRMRDEGQGGILLSAHLGNWEMAGNLLKGRVTPTINVVMLDSEVERIKKYLDHETGGSRFRIIAIKDDLSHVIKINRALQDNEFVAIHADRFIDGSKNIELPFLGHTARFPAGPFLIASRFKAPVTFVFGVKKSDYVYHLSATFPMHAPKKPEEIARAFVSELEHRVRKNPEQWFNYFPFFAEDACA